MSLYDYFGLEHHNADLGAGCSPSAQGFDTQASQYTGGPRCRHEYSRIAVLHGAQVEQCLACGTTVLEDDTPEREDYPEESQEAPDKEC